MPRRAVLVFADEIYVDRARRSFPRAAEPLLHIAALDSQIAQADLHLFTSARETVGDGARVHRQAGRTFAARFEDAIERIAHYSYDEIVVVGRDCPALCAADIERAFGELSSKRLILGPDHQGGCYLIAFHSRDRALVRGVRWKQNTDCAQLSARCKSDELFLLPVKQDLDSWADVRVLSRGDDPLARLGAFLLDVICAVAARLIYFISIASQQMRVRQQMPPPAFAA